MNGQVHITKHASERCRERVGSIDLPAAYRRSRPLTARERHALLRDWIRKGTWPRKHLRCVDALYLIDPRTRCLLVCRVRRRSRTLVTVLPAPPRVMPPEEPAAPELIARTQDAAG